MAIRCIIVCVVTLVAFFAAGAVAKVTAEWTDDEHYNNMPPM
jgi:hypothetical protein